MVTAVQQLQLVSSYGSAASEGRFRMITRTRDCGRGRLIMVMLCWSLMRPKWLHLLGGCEQPSEMIAATIAVISCPLPPYPLSLLG